MSFGQLGQFSVLLAFGLVGYGIVTGVLGLVRREGRLLVSARVAAIATFVALTTALAVMEAALLTDDFSVKYVAETSSILSPLWVKIVTLWAALEGSILLWAWILSGYTALLATISTKSALRPCALVVLHAVQLFFIGVVAFVADPFITLSVPPLDGPGPNPLLQNHWMMAVHPVLTYLGVVGLTVPFAYAIAALITRRPGTEWMRETRAWTLAGWGFLTAAIAAGGWWSYEVLGWGGYWAWDPVENVILLPWLTATAFLHSVQVQERRRMLKAWNVFLIVLTFNLSILATFLIRSGVLSSVHSFGDGPVGPVFLGFFLLITLCAFGLVALRWDQLRDQAELDNPVSREGSFLLNNVLFTAIAFAVLLGTLFPLAVEAVTGDKVTVGAPFFNSTTVPLWLVLLALMGIGPLLPWRRAGHQSLFRNLRWLLIGAATFGLAGYLLGVRKPYPLATVALAGLNLVSLALLLGGAIRTRTMATGRPALAVLRDYARESRRRFGSMIVHFGIVVVALGVAGSGGYRVDTQMRLEVGNSAVFEGYQLTLERIFVEELPQKSSQGATIKVGRNGRTLATLRPVINSFRNSQQSVATPAVMYRPLEDLYLNLSLVDETAGSIVLRTVRSPFVTWIWLGILVVLLGTVYALSPAVRAGTRAPTEPALR